MARDAVAKIMPPRQCGGRAVGEVVEAREIATDAADRDPDRKRQREARAGARGDPGTALVELDRHDATRDGALDRAGKAWLMRQPQIGGAEDDGPHPGAEHKHRDIAPIARRGERKIIAPRHPTDQQRGRGPSDHVENRVKNGAAHVAGL